MKNFKLAILTLLITGIAFYSCDKDDKTDDSSDTDTNTAADNSTAENFDADIFSTVDDAAKNSQETGKTGGLHKFSSDSICATITVNPPFPDTTFPKTITIAFGDSNCTGSDGRTRRGKIIATLTGKYREAGTVVTVTTENFYINDNKIEGTKTITNNGYNVDSNLTYTVKVDSAKIYTSDGDTISWESTRTNEWVEGDSTKSDIFDDVYHITGSASGTNRSGNSFTVTITKELRKEIGCRWFVSGTVDVEPAGKTKRTIDYGDGACDNLAKVTIGTYEKEITLR